MNEELKFLRKFTKNRGGGGSGRGVELGGGVRLGVNEKIKVFL